MSELSAEFVKRGYWVNLSHGRIMGQTLTTDTKTGSAIVALLAVCTTLGMRHLWHIITFCSHQIRADGRPAEGLVRQQQALLRTLPAPSSFMADSIKLVFAWRKIASKKVLGHSITQIVMAFLFTVGSLAAGIFASYVVSGSNLEVLVKSPYCGLLEARNTSTYSHNYMAQLADVSERYARECYEDENILPARCNIFIHPRVNFTTEEAPCPFPGQCISPAVTFDTGIIDVIKQFGLNMASDNGIKHRVRRTCAVLSPENRTSIVNASDMPLHLLGRIPDPGERVLLAHLGTREGEPPGSPWANANFGVSLQRLRPFQFKTVAYRVSQSMADEFQPLPEFIVRDADTILLAVFHGGARYRTQTDDPMFSAHRPTEPILDIKNIRNITFYLPDTPMSVLGCTEQFQFCFANGSAAMPCTELGGLHEPFTKTGPFPGASELQLTLANLLVYFAYEGTFTQINSLNISSLLSGSILGYVPVDQWKQETKRVMTTNFAALQTLISDIAIGPAARDSSSAHSYKMPPESEGVRKLCTMQKMCKGGGFVNINVFALSFVLAISASAVLLDLALLRILIFLSRFRKALSPRIDRWIQDGIFQLQRRAYEARGEGQWTDLDKEIPVTVGNQLLSDLPTKVVPVASLSALSGGHDNTALAAAQSNSSVTTQLANSSNASSSNSVTVEQGSLPPAGETTAVNSDGENPDLPEPTLENQEAEMTEIAH